MGNETENRDSRLGPQPEAGTPPATATPARTGLYLPLIFRQYAGGRARIYLPVILREYDQLRHHPNSERILFLGSRPFGCPPM